jgi:hypothetical protein
MQPDVVANMKCSHLSIDWMQIYRSEKTFLYVWSEKLVELMKHIIIVTWTRVYTTRCRSSAIGLAHTIQKDPVTNNFIYQNGAMVRQTLWFLYLKLKMHSNDFQRIQLSDLVYAHLQLILFCHSIKEFSKVYLIMQLFIRVNNMVPNQQLHSFTMYKYNGLCTGAKPRWLSLVHVHHGKIIVC